MAQHLRYGEPDWSTRPIQYLNGDIPAYPLSTKSYEELRFDQLVADGSVKSDTPYINSLGRQEAILGLKNQDVLTLMVAEGPSVATWKIHEDVIVASSKFVEGAMKHHFIERSSRIIRLPTERPYVIEHYVKWLYSGQINTADHDDLIQMVMLGDRIIDDKFQEACYGALKASLKPFTLKHILYILDNVLEHHSLYKLCISEVGRGIVSGQYNFDRNQLEKLAIYMPDLMRAVMDAVAARSGFPYKSADESPTSHSHFGPFGSQAQASAPLVPSHYTPNIGWHYTQSASNPQAPTGGLWGRNGPAGAADSSSTSTLFGPAPATSGTRSSGSTMFGPKFAPSTSAAAWPNATFGSTNPVSTTAPPSTGVPYGRAPTAFPAAQPSDRSVFGSGLFVKQDVTTEANAQSSSPLTQKHTIPFNLSARPTNGGLRVRLDDKFPVQPQASASMRSSNPFPGLFGRMGDMSVNTETQTPMTAQQTRTHFTLGHPDVVKSYSSSKLVPPVPSGIAHADNGNKYQNLLFGRSSAVPIRHPTKTPLELWLGKDVPPKASKLSATRPPNAMTGGLDPMYVEHTAEVPAVVDPSKHSAQQTPSQGKGKGKERDPDWGQTNSSSTDGIIYTPASSSASSAQYFGQDAESTVPASDKSDKVTDFRSGSPKAVPWPEWENGFQKVSDTTSKTPAQQHTTHTPKEVQERLEFPKTTLADATDDLADQGQTQSLDARTNTYRTQLAILEQQNKQRLLVQNFTRTSAPVRLTKPPQSTPRDLTAPSSSTSAFQSITEDPASGFGKYAVSNESGFAQMGDKPQSSLASSFGNSTSFETGQTLMSSASGVAIPEPPQFGFPTPLMPPPAIAATRVTRDVIRKQ